MTKQELLQAIYTERYLDFNTLVRPNQTDITTDNGVLFTSIAQVLSEVDYQQHAIDACFLEPGLLNRKPNDTVDQEQFDDYLGLAVGSIYTSQTKHPRDILLYGLKHLFVFNTDNNLQGKDWLGRDVFVFMVLFAAAFPLLKWVVWPFLTLYCLFLNPTTLADSSGIQLQWLYLMAHSKLFGPTLYNKWYTKYKTNIGSFLSAMFSTYYTPNHPFVEFVKTNLD